MKLSNTIKNMQFSPIRKLNTSAQAAILKGIDILHLNIGQPDIKTPEGFYIRLKNFNEDIVAYKPSNGTINVIENFKDYFNELGYNVSSEDIMITNGASEALLFAIRAICDFGDEILTTDPYYGNYKTFADINGVNIKTFKTVPEDGFKIPSEEEIEKSVTSKTRAILYSNPSNPTGAVYSKEEIKRICSVAVKHDLFIITDEVYREFIYEDMEYYSPMFDEDLKERVILVDSVSKRYSACGVRIGALVSKNTEFLNECSKMSQSRLSSPTVEMHAASGLFEHEKEFLKETREEYKKRRDMLYEGLNKIEGVKLEKPTGAFYAIVTLPVDDSEKFAKFLLEDFSLNGETIMVAPAGGFYEDPKRGINQVRISYCVDTEKLARGIKILESALKEYNG